MTENVPALKRDFPNMLEKFKSEIVRALPKHLNGDRMCRIALTEFRKNPKLASCDPKSVFAAVIQASQLGLEVGLLGEASLVPFGTECQLIPGYIGLMKLAMNTGKVSDIYAHSVRANDEFEIIFGLDRTLRHKPLMDGSFPASDEMRGSIVGYYAVCIFNDGKKTFQAMSNADILKIRDSSKGYKACKKFGKVSIWDEHAEAMGIKTVIRRLCKYLPKSPELAAALELDNIADHTGKQSLSVTDAIDGTWSPDYTDSNNAIDVSPKASDTLADKLKSKLPQPVVEQQPEHIRDTTEKVTEPVHTTFRDEYINLKQAGFSTFVFQNLDRMKNCSETLHAEAVAKWNKLYVDQHCPFLNRKDDSTDTSIDSTHTDQPKPKAPIVCKKDEQYKGVFPRDCVDCGKLDGCDQYSEYIFDLEHQGQPESSDSSGF